MLVIFQSKVAILDACLWGEGTSDSPSAERLYPRDELENSPKSTTTIY